jgi:hypothetical protein
MDFKKKKKICLASQLEDTLAKEREEVDNAFPCCQDGMFN